MQNKCTGIIKVWYSLLKFDIYFKMVLGCFLAPLLPKWLTAPLISHCCRQYKAVAIYKAVTIYKAATIKYRCNWSAISLTVTTGWVQMPLQLTPLTAVVFVLCYSFGLLCYSCFCFVLHFWSVVLQFCSVVLQLFLFCVTVLECCVTVL